LAQDEFRDAFNSMESSASERSASAAGAVARRDRTRLAAARTALLSMATILVTCVVINAALITAPESQDTYRKSFLLVASPDMPDPLFQQAVILMLPPATPPLVAGIVINKPTKMNLGQLFSHSPAIGNQAQAVYFGGPVDMSSPVILMRRSRAPAATTRLFENVYMSIDEGSIRAFLKGPESDKDLRLFLGRAQWTADQLHSEILRGAWTISRASPELVFSPDPVGVWRVLVQQAKLREIKEDFSKFEQPFGLCTPGSKDTGACGREVYKPIPIDFPNAVRPEP
jgi:putative transcriptional regulator